MFPGDLELDALFEDHGVCFAVDEDMLTLERAVYHSDVLGNNYFSSGRQRINRQPCARFLADLVAAAVLPLHTADFPLQPFGLRSYVVRKGCQRH